jgi:hypothetical protein
MAKPNYAFAKHQRDLQKQRKKQEKQQRKSAAKSEPATATGGAGEEPSATAARDDAK